jgi:threonine/homoserine/homoserine lactone efflux protein
MTLALIGMICAMSMMPGSSTTVILDTTWSYGRGPGSLAALGGSAAVAIYTGLAVGAGAFLSSDGLWVHVLEGAGALYLATLGIMALIEAASIQTRDEQQEKSALGLQVFLSGFMSTILSPKTALFYLVILSQHAFSGLPAAHGILLAGLLHICFRLVWYGTWIHLIEPVRRTLKTVWMQRALKVTTASTMLALSIYIFR